MCNPAIEIVRVDRGRAWSVSICRCCRIPCWSRLGERERLLRLRDLGHGGRGEEAAAFQLPFLLLLQQLSAHQPGDGGVVWEDADDVAAALDEGVGLSRSAADDNPL